MPERPDPETAQALAEVATHELGVSRAEGADLAGEGERVGLMGWAQFEELARQSRYRMALILLITQVIVNETVNGLKIPIFTFSASVAYLIFERILRKEAIRCLPPNSSQMTLPLSQTALPPLGKRILNNLKPCPKDPIPRQHRLWQK